MCVHVMAKSETHISDRTTRKALGLLCRAEGGRSGEKFRGQEESRPPVAQQHRRRASGTVDFIFNLLKVTE